MKDNKINTLSCSEKSNEFRRKELDLAYCQAMEDIKNKKLKVQSAEEHLEELKRGL
ncbi:MAG: hypothetical protein OIF32_00890 [Campylobacterales bacterium]|nr:hypothetical protein [Campylobacterales bacterium]